MLNPLAAIAGAAALMAPPALWLLGFLALDGLVAAARLRRRIRRFVRSRASTLLR